MEGAYNTGAYQNLPLVPGGNYPSQLMPSNSMAQNYGYNAYPSNIP